MIKKNEYNHEKLTIAVIFSVIAAIFSAMSFLFNTNETTVLRALNKMEAYKVGGESNWNKLQNLYNSQSFKDAQSKNIDDAIQAMGGTAQNPDNNNPTQPNADASLSQDQISDVLKDEPLLGNEDSNIVLVEYTDFECPFCQKHFDNGTIDELIKSEDISYVLKQFPLSSIHPLAQKSAEGALCILDLGNKDNYYEYISKIFTSKDPSLTNITSIAKSLGIKEADFNECLTSNRMAKKVNQDMQEGQTLFGVNGTPGNVLINKKTGKYVVVSGAQPLSAFQSALAQIK